MSGVISSRVLTLLSDGRDFESVAAITQQLVKLVTDI